MDYEVESEEEWEEEPEDGEQLSVRAAHTHFDWLA